MASTRNQKSQSQGLKRLFIKFYQGHKKSVLNFHPGINVITGKSHNGKSSIVRALKKLTFNRPMGAKFYSNFAPAKGSTIIKARFFDGITAKYQANVTKKTKDGKTVKTATSQKYELGKDSFKGLRGQVPDAVIQAINLSEINFQYQHDQPLLLETSNTKLAKLISDITKLDKAYEAKAELQQRWRKAKTEQTVSEEVISDLTKRLKKFKGLKKIQTTLAELGIRAERQKRVERGLEDLGKLRRITSEIKRIEKHLTTVGSTVKLIERKEAEVFVINNRMLQLSESLRTSMETIRVKDELEKANKTLRKVLVDAGECPTCGQTTTGL